MALGRAGLGGLGHGASRVRALGTYFFDAKLLGTPHPPVLRLPCRMVGAHTLRMPWGAQEPRALGWELLGCQGRCLVTAFKASGPPKLGQHWEVDSNEKKAEEDMTVGLPLS